MCFNGLRKDFKLGWLLNLTYALSGVEFIVYIGCLGMAKMFVASMMRSIEIEKR